MAAGYSTSLLVNAQAILSRQMQAPEFRTKEYNVAKLMMRNAAGLLPDLNTIKTSDSRTVETYLREKTTIATGAARTYDPSGAFGDTQQANLSWTTVSAVAQTSLKVADRNVFTAAELLANEIQSAHIAMADAIETAAATYLETYKSQVNAASGEYTSLGAWDGTEYAWQVPNGSLNYFFQYIGTIMKVNKYHGMVDLVCDPVSYSIAKQLLAQGSSNATNTSFQFDGMTIMMSTDLTNDDGVTGTVYAIPKGTVAMVDWIPAANRRGAITNNYKYSTIGDVSGMGLTLALFEAQEGTDSNTTGAEVQDVNYLYESSVDYSFVKALLSTSNEYPIFKFQLLNT